MTEEYMPLNTAQKKYLVSCLPQEVGAKWIEDNYNERFIEDAQIKYKKQIEKDKEDGYTGDFICGLCFVIMTYSPHLWLEFFVPDNMYKEDK